ncbi:replicative DNA helicase [Aliifodinibius sp. S!AR15-10]|uniref:replicative DNA helicase n=1 Tax=Aliifodinibius sp. S!AR15-10 TaxID=2950437 RepID=UPI00285EEE5B|nr:replicative DNA helicase [Aliifodinibius sp. S!AR15-10]MDR8392368.1 replicative DNA helicase [Aliifodinibius sp. S!AR15-10]
MSPDQNGSNFRKQNKSSSDLLEREGRVPPQAVEVEEAVLGAMLIEHEAATVALQMLRSEDFYKPAHQHIFEVLHDLYERDNPLDLLTVENELRDKGMLDTIGGAGYLSELTRSVSSAANIDYHAQIISEKATKRNLILGCTDIIQEAYDSTSDPYDVLDKAEQRIFDIANQKQRAQATPIGDVLKDTLSYLEDIRGKPSGITGVPSGLDIDNYTAGWQKGDMVIIAARPSMGKTAFVLTAARNAALHQDDKLQTNVAFFSLEMSAQSLVQRFLTMEARINAQKARSGRLDDEEFKRLIDAAGRLFTANIFVDDTPGLSIMELRTKARRLKSEHDIGVIIVDYLQLMTTTGKDFGTREQEIASISRGLKALAKELDVPVIALSQLSRAVEQRGGDKRPQLSDLRESGSIEQDADVVCFLYRPEYYGIKTTPEGESTTGLSEIIIGKQRNGPTGSQRLYFVKEYARFENLTSASPSPYKGQEESSDGSPDTNSDSSAGTPPIGHDPGPDEDEAPF